MLEILIEIAKSVGAAYSVYMAYGDDQDLHKAIAGLERQQQIIIKEVAAIPGMILEAELRDIDSSLSALREELGQAAEPLSSYDIARLANVVGDCHQALHRLSSGVGQLRAQAGNLDMERAVTDGVGLAGAGAYAALLVGLAAHKLAATTSLANDKRQAINEVIEICSAVQGLVGYFVDRRFGPPKVIAGEPEPGGRKGHQYGYTFDGRFVVVLEAPSSRPPPANAMQTVRAELAAHKTVVLQGAYGAAQLTQIRSQVGAL